MSLTLASRCTWLPASRPCFLDGTWAKAVLVLQQLRHGDGKALTCKVDLTQRATYEPTQQETGFVPFLKTHKHVLHTHTPLTFGLSINQMESIVRSYFFVTISFDG